MTITDYSTAIVNAMLGWLKGLANWVLRLFNLAGSGGTSPLLWLSKNWLFLLTLLMIVGVAGDLLVWIFRWRPHWVWFRRERVIVDDERFFNDADIRDQLDDDGDDGLRRNWSERDYVVSSTLVKPKSPRNKRAKRRSTREDRRTYVQRSERRESVGVDARPDPGSTRRQADGEPPKKREHRDMFDLNTKRPGVTDLYEDEVFNVSSLPRANDFPFEDKTDRTEA